MKRCPYCAEKIQDEAALCRYCGKAQPETRTPKKVENIKWDKKKILLPVGVALGVLILSVGGYFLFTKMSVPASAPASQVGSALAQIAIAPSSTPTPAPTATSTPTATLTPTVTPTPTTASTLRPTPIPTDELLLYQTDFENDDASLAKWRTFAYSFSSHSLGTEGYEVATNTSLYRFNATETNQRIFAIYDADLGTSDVDISLHTNPPPNNGGLGLVCRYTEAGWYQFMIEPTDKWSIWMAKVDEAGQLHFYKLGEGGYFYFSRYQRLEIRLECKGDRLTIYAEGTKLASLHEDTFPTGKVGLAGWSFTDPGQVALIDKFTVQRAQWSESTATGPAPTPAADGTFYTTQFEDLNAFSKTWFSFSPFKSGNLYYINDFDPGTGNVEISADFRNDVTTRGLICRYSEDGWYAAVYSGGGGVTLTRIERELDGVQHSVDLGGAGVSGDANPTQILTLTLTCTGNQISVSIDGKTLLWVEDGTFTTGRFGLVVDKLDPPVSLRTAFTSYTVRPAKAPAHLQPGEILFSNVFDTPQEFESKWGWITNDPHVKIQDDSVLLTSGDTGIPFTEIGLSNGTLSENAELAMDVEFLAESWINLYCRNTSTDRSSFHVHSSGTWDLVTSGQNLAHGNSTSIHPDRNQFTMRCVGNQLTLIANGETVATVEQPSYLPTVGDVGFYLKPDNSQIKLTSLTLKVLQGSPLPPASTLPNQVVLPVFEPGAEIYQTDFSDLGEVAYFNKRNIIFPESRLELPGYVYLVNFEYRESGFDPMLAGIYIKNGVKALYQQDMSDMAVEVNAEATFSEEAPGPMVLVCRYNVMGSYEFSILPDGKWAITRNGPLDYDFRIPAVILAQGESSAIKPDRNQMTATCQGSDLIFSVNGEELGRAQDDLFVDGKVGIGVGPDSAGTFANFSVRLK